MPSDRFVLLWYAAPSWAAFLKLTGLTARQARARRSVLRRRHGLKLPPYPDTTRLSCPGLPQVVQVAQLMLRIDSGGLAAAVHPDIWSLAGLDPRHESVYRSIAVWSREDVYARFSIQYRLAPLKEAL